jgi:hypothetical protein
MSISERCAICGCGVHRSGEYAKPTKEGRSHATRHHYVAQRFFGRSSNRKGTLTERVFAQCPWGQERRAEVFCYECHELLLHNPVLLPEDVARFAELVRRRGLAEEEKPEDFSRIAARIALFHEVIARGLLAMAAD